MKIIVYPHALSIGGSQINAVDLAAGVRDRGHDVAVFGRPGPLADYIRQVDLELIPAPDSKRRPAPEIMKRLVDLCRDRQIDLVHGYEWPPALEAYYGPQLALGVPALASVLSMTVASFLPPSMPLTVCTAENQARAQRDRRAKVELLDMPVDITANHPAFDPGDFRETHGVPDGRPLVVCVSRLARELKQEGLERAIAAAEQLNEKDPMTLVIVGGGPAEQELRAQAAEVNDRVGEGTVILTGQLMDPRPAYAAADLLIGMGGSTLRGAAFGKASIVLGEDGFSEFLSPETLHMFQWYGFYGLGDGDRGPDRLVGQIRELVDDTDRRAELAAYARELIVGSYSQAALSEKLEGIYRKVLAEPPPRTRALAEGAVSAAQVVGYKLERRRARRSGRAASDDFNARPKLEPPPAAIVKRESPSS